MSQEDEERSTSLLGYLQIRNWSLANIKAIVTGMDPQFIDINATLYISYVFAAIDFVADSLEDAGKEVFLNSLAHALPTGFFAYARELRNAIVHRGLNAVPGGIEVNKHLQIILPERVTNRKGTSIWQRPVEYWHEFGLQLNTASNQKIQETIEANGWLPEHARPEAGEEMRAAVKSAPIPFPVDVLQHLYKQIDHLNEYQKWAEQIVVSRRAQILDALAVS